MSHAQLSTAFAVAFLFLVGAFFLATQERGGDE